MLFAVPCVMQGEDISVLFWVYSFFACSCCFFSFGAVLRLFSKMCIHSAWFHSEVVLRQCIGQYALFCWSSLWCQQCFFLSSVLIISLVSDIIQLWTGTLTSRLFVESIDWLVVDVSGTPGGGGTHVYWQYRYVRPLRPPFHALPAVPKHIFFIARRSKAYLFHWPTRSYGTQLKSQFSRPPFHVKSQFPRPPFGEGPLVLKPLGS